MIWSANIMIWNVQKSPSLWFLQILTLFPQVPSQKWISALFFFPQNIWPFDFSSVMSLLSPLLPLCQVILPSPHSLHITLFIAHNHLGSIIPLSPWELFIIYTSPTSLKFYEYNFLISIISVKPSVVPNKWKNTEKSSF